MDYLSNLALRSFSAGEGLESVRPRLPSLFEPRQETRGVSMGIPSRPPELDETRDETLAPAPPRVEERPVRPEMSVSLGNSIFFKKWVRMIVGML